MCVCARACASYFPHDAGQVSWFFSLCELGMRTTVELRYCVVAFTLEVFITVMRLLLGCVCNLHSQ